ncbi:MAG: hypothetical protein WCJ64_13705 [Rhodospirillaceae bacterium]
MSDEHTPTNPPPGGLTTADGKFRNSELLAPAASIADLLTTLRQTGGEVALAGERSHDALYRAFESVLRFKVCVEGRADDLVAQLKAEGVELTLAGNNAPVHEQLSPYVKLCFGLEKKSIASSTDQAVKMARLKLQKIVSDYTAAIAEAVTQGVESDGIAAFFKLPGNGVVSLARTYRQRMASSDAPPTESSAVDALAELPDIAILEDSDLGDHGKGPVVLVGVSEGDSRWLIKAFSQDEALVRRLVRVAAPARRTKPSKKVAVLQAEAAAAV